MPSLIKPAANSAGPTACNSPAISSPMHLTKPLLFLATVLAGAAYAADAGQTFYGQTAEYVTVYTDSTRTTVDFTTTGLSYTPDRVWPFRAGEYVPGHVRYVPGLPETVLGKPFAWEMDLAGPNDFVVRTELSFPIQGAMIARWNGPALTPPIGNNEVGPPGTPYHPYLAGLGPFLEVGEYPAVNPFDRAAVAAHLDAWDVPAAQPTWTNYDTATDNVGTISDAERIATAHRVNFFRAMAGLEQLPVVDTRGSANLQHAAYYVAGLNEAQRATTLGWTPQTTMRPGEPNTYERGAMLVSDSLSRMVNSFRDRGCLPAGHPYVNTKSILAFAYSAVSRHGSANLVDEMILEGSSPAFQLLSPNATLLSVGFAGGGNSNFFPTLALSTRDSTAAEMNSGAFTSLTQGRFGLGLFGTCPSPMNWTVDLGSEGMPTFTMMAWPYAGYVPYQYVSSRWSVWQDQHLTGPPIPLDNPNGAKAIIEVRDERDTLIESSEVRDIRSTLGLEDTVFFTSLGDSARTPLVAPAMFPKPTRERTYRVRIPGLRWYKPSTGSSVRGTTGYGLGSLVTAVPIPEAYEYDVTVFDPDAPASARATIPTEYPVSEDPANTTFRVRKLGQYTAKYSQRPWIRHSSLGLLAVVGAKRQRVGWETFLYDWKTKHYWWTTETYFPWVYDYKERSWLYYYDGIPGERWFWSHATQSWGKR